jgi:hypothetical protein
VTRPRRVGGADRVDPQLLAKFASKIHVSTHLMEASESGRWPSAILRFVDRELYRRRQRRRAFIAWSVAVLVIAIAAVVVIFGGDEDGRDGPTPPIHLFSSEMTSEQYEGLHEGESESKVLLRLQSVGLQEDEVEASELPGLFPVRPPHSTCSYWTLSDAPGHLVRLCFSDPKGVLLQKSAVVSGDEAAPRTFA